MASFINDEDLKRDGEIVQRLNGLEQRVDEAKSLMQRTQSKVDELETLLVQLKEKESPKIKKPLETAEPAERPSTSGGF